MFLRGASGRKNKMRIRHLLMVVLLAAMAFGGSFTCVAHSGDSHVHDPQK